MIKLTYREKISFLPYEKDLERMKKILNDNGYDATYHSIYNAWRNYSETFSAGWLMLYTLDEHNLNHLLEYLEEE